MRIRVIGACMLAAVALGVTACGSSGGLAGGIASSSCKVVWTYASSNGNPVYPTYAAAFKAAYAEDVSSNPEGVNNTPQGEGNMPYQVSNFSITAGKTVNVGQVTLAYYTKSGAEISSSQFGINEMLTSGQSNRSQESTPSNSASCKVVAWTPGQN